MTARPQRQNGSAPPPPTAGLVLCAKSPHWRRAWRRELAPGVPLVEAPLLEEVWPRLQDFRHGGLALEFRTEQAPAQAALLARIQAELPQVLVVAQLDERDHAWELLLREAGARHVVYSTRQVERAAGIVTRHLARAPVVKLPWREELWQRLPWSSVPHTPDATATALPPAAAE